MIDIFLRLCFNLMGGIGGFLIGYIWGEQERRFGKILTIVGMMISLIAWIILYYFISGFILFIH